MWLRPSIHLRRRRVIVAVSAAACMAFSQGARAEGVADAEEQLRRGLELRAKGVCAEAVVALRSAALQPTTALPAQRNLAECEETLRHYATARRAWLAVQHAEAALPEPRHQALAVEAQAAADRLSARVAKLRVDVIAVRDGSDVPRGELQGLKVRLNGDTLPLDQLGAFLERDPGSVTVHATKTSDGTTAVASVYLGEGDSRRVKLRLESDGKPVSVTADSPGPSRALAYAALGLGVASLACAGVALGLRESGLSDVDAQCPSHVGCDPRLKATVDRGRTATIAFDVLGALGLVATGAGVALLLKGPGAAASPPRTGLRVRPGIGGFSAEWRWW